MPGWKTITAALTTAAMLDQAEAAADCWTFGAGFEWGACWYAPTLYGIALVTVISCCVRKGIEHYRFERQVDAYMAAQEAERRAETARREEERRAETVRREAERRAETARREAERKRVEDSRAAAAAPLLRGAPPPGYGAVAEVRITIPAAAERPPLATVDKAHQIWILRDLLRKPVEDMSDDDPEKATRQRLLDSKNLDGKGVCMSCSPDESETSETGERIVRFQFDAPELAGQFYCHDCAEEMKNNPSLPLYHGKPYRQVQDIIIERLKIFQGIIGDEAAEKRSAARVRR